MPLSLSPPAEMLAAVRGYIEAEILPGLRDDQWFTIKVAINVLAMVERELRLGPDTEAAAISRLAALTGATGSLDDLTRALALAIREGRIALDDPALLAHLRRTTDDALRINNPQWLGS